MIGEKSVQVSDSLNLGVIMLDNKCDLNEFVVSCRLTAGEGGR